jgi:predicted nucleic acid-binding protein
VIYIDTSVALAQLLAEERLPPVTLWRQPLVSSRLLEYEVWTRIHARRLGRSLGDDIRALLGRIAFLELVAPVLARALDPYPTAVRTLDSLHLASIEFLREQGQAVELATYDKRLASAADALKIPIFPLDAEK